MDLSNLDQLKSLLKQNKALAKKSFGQHFLVDSSVLEDILKAANLAKPDRKRKILEIGPGLGVLTQELIQIAGLVVAVEADHEMVGVLIKILKNPSNLTIVPKAIQVFRRDEYFEDLEYDLISNLPYSVSSYVLGSFLEQRPRPRQLVVMMQKEVAQRVMAGPGDRARGVLSLALEILADKVELVRLVSPNSFWPMPKVESAVVKIISKPEISPQAESILKLAKKGFNSRRKQIANSLSQSGSYSKSEILSILNSSDIDPNLRPQDLTLNQWQKINQKMLTPR